MYASLSAPATFITPERPAADSDAQEVSPELLLSMGHDSVLTIRSGSTFAYQRLDSFRHVISVTG